MYNNILSNYAKDQNIKTFAYSFANSSFVDSSFANSSFVDSSFANSSFVDSSFVDSPFANSSFVDSSFSFADPRFSKLGLGESEKYRN